MNKKTLETIIRLACLPLTIALLPIYAISTIFTDDTFEDIIEFATAWCNYDNYHVFEENIK